MNEWRHHSIPTPHREGRSLILLAFLLPLAFYILVLGIINRRPHPLLASGPWDFAGILFAASGILVFGGPFVLSTLNENVRLFFLIGPHKGGGDGDPLWVLWLVSSVLYLIVVVGGAAGTIYLQRKRTVIYNVDMGSFEEAFDAACARLGLRPARSGASYLFDPARDLLAAKSLTPSEGIATETRSSPALRLPESREIVLMELDYFQAMRHLTLRWSTADSLVRREVETELAAQLNEIVVGPGELGGWLVMLAFLLLAASFLIAFADLVYRFVHRI
jgi:hypothetical protein